ncbi:Uncharacterised protein [Mycobacterium tuberculosis]|nr:Uncharacterised protein [Mycobacterium tuberculosis]
MFAQLASHVERDVQVAGRVAALGHNRRRQSDPEGGYHVAKRTAVVTSEHDDHVGIELSCALGRRRQCRAEPVTEGVLDVAFLARAVACTDNQPVCRHVAHLR